MKEYSVYIKDAHNCDAEFDLDTEAVIAEFEANGFKVTEEAIAHNFNAWSGDYKSGYRDEENDYFLFTPCGCNQLRFEAMELIDGADYQTTYIA